MKVIKQNHKVQRKINPREIQQSYMEKMEKDLTNKGAVFFEPGEKLHIDEDNLSLPAEITEVTSRDLGELLNAFTQQKVYLRTLLGRTELCVEESRRKYFEISEEYYRKYSTLKMSETAKDKLINAQEEVRPVYYEYMDFKKKQTLVEYSIANVEDIIFMISREVTRRNGDFNEENRSYNVSRK